ncbi:hypothetical protein [Sulfuricella sp.]|uniref:hypothetical protein n=1 Tax=Sulfuricella sp. TaxID=2099377 RepID=UPI002C9E5FC8|nr:hypothetical protein [Sulfuricella sp.]HUX62229.1 hypothetical protein [Sulfuricella sp.]
MANAILPEEYLVPPVVSQDELEDLIVQVDPDIEDRPYWHLKASAAQLRDAVEKLLLGYRQSIFMAEHGASMLPAQLWLLAETISANYRQAWIYAESARTVTPAFELFLANMDIEMVAP